MKTLALAIALSMALIGCSDQSRTKGDIRAGQAFADRECKGCHGLDGKGVAPAIPNLGGQHEHYLLASLAAYREGKRTHAALRAIAGRMTDTNTRNVAAYYASLPAVGEERDVPVFSPYEAGKELAPSCARCHGEDGNSKTPGIPSLAGQQPGYFVLAISEYLTGIRETAPMHSLVRNLTKLEMESVAIYFASQMPAQRAPAGFGDAARGEPLTAACGGCHGSRGVSIDTATPSVAAQDPQYLVNATKAYGKTRKHLAMQRSVAGLNDSDIENIVAFYTVQRSKAAELGRTLLRDQVEKCNRCHADDVKSPAIAIPKISGQDKEYLAMALRAYRDDKRMSSLMHNMSMPYSDSVIESLASFYASQPSK
jgi:cytochrome c553